MLIRPIKTRILQPPKDDLLAVIKFSLKKLPEKSILAITSKVVAIWQGQCIPRQKILSKDQLIIAESDKYLDRTHVPQNAVMHTIKNNLFIPSAGIDESNANNYYILWPKNLEKTAYEIWKFLKRTYKTKNFGIIITDSHTIPLRRGVTGISLGYFGFEPLKNYVGTRDLFGRKLKITQANYVDSLATAAVLIMGEGTESTPLSLITNLPFIKFINHPFKTKNKNSTLEIEEKTDLYYPLLSSVPWKKGGGGKKLKNKLQ
jgi:putative folate metabolism gamma-glutamate ligase